jgi:peptide/nickel transport system substrate-binding protein
MTHALNIPMYLEKITYNLEKQCYGVFHPSSWMFNPQIKLLPYDLKKASALLDEAGWKTDPGDGWRYKDVNGRRVKFDFTILVPQGSSTGEKVAAVFQEDLKKIGVQMNTRVLEWSAFMEKVDKHEFQAEIAAWGVGSDPDGEYNLWRTEEYKTGRNYGGYSNPRVSNPRVDELLEAGRTEFDQDKRAKIYQEIEMLLYEDQPYTWISNRSTLSTASKRIRGVQLSPSGMYTFDPSYFAWWTPKGSASVAAKP